MKCEIILDLLPLYIEGLTNQTTAEEMERHLKKCGKCRQYYKEMTGKLPDILPKAETDSVKLLKKERKRRRKIHAVIEVLCFLLFMAVLAVMPRDINYKDVQLEYGMNGNKAYVSMRPKPYVGGIVFNGEVKTLRDENGESIGVCQELEVLSGWGMLGRLGKKGGCSWESDPSDGRMTEWKFTFHDKVVTIRNGELVSIYDANNEKQR